MALWMVYRAPKDRLAVAIRTELCFVEAKTYEAAVRLGRELLPLGRDFKGVEAVEVTPNRNFYI